MVLSLVMVDFVDRDGGMYDGWLNGFLLDDRLDSLKHKSMMFQYCVEYFANLVNVVVDMFSSNHWCHGVTLLGTALYPRILELRTLLLETCSNGLFVAMAELPMLDGDDVVLVLFRKYFAVFDWLDRGMVVVLVYLTVNGGLSFFMANLCDLLVHNGRCHFLVDSGVMMTSLVPVKMNTLVDLTSKTSRDPKLDSREGMHW